MIDWLSLTAPCTTEIPINAGTMIALTPDGATEYQTSRRLMLAGSYDHRIAIRSDDPYHVHIQGNPAKFLQGHNLWGTDDLRKLVPTLLRAVCDRLGIVPDPADLRAWRDGSYDLTRIDLTRSYDLGTPERVAAFLVAVGQVGRIPQQRRDTYGDETVVFGQGSSRYTLTLYDKRKEIAQHPLSPFLDPVYREQLNTWAAGKLRVELSVRSHALTDGGMRSGAAWTPDRIDTLLDARLGKLQLPDTARLSDATLDTLPPKLIPIYDSWKAGRDLRAIYRSDATFYRHRAALLPYGIDIGQPRPRAVVATDEYLVGTPLRSFLNGPGVSPPVWAVEAVAA